MKDAAPRLTEADQRAAIARLREEANRGAIPEQRVRELTAAVWASNTPHELYRRTHGLLGERHRRDTGDWWRIVALYAAICLAMVLFTWLTVLAAKDGLFGTQ